MNPDEEMRGRWLEDELVGEELSAALATFGSQPEHQTQLTESRRWKEWLRSVLPEEEEPASPAIFNARIMREIEKSRNLEPEAAVHKSVKRSPILAWLIPVAAAAGMAFGFFLGAGKKEAPQIVDIDVTGAPRAIPVEPVLYTPEIGVKASWFQSTGADAYVIVLDGVPPIPDEIEFSRSMSMVDPQQEGEAMAELDGKSHAGGGS